MDRHGAEQTRTTGPNRTPLANLVTNFAAPDDEPAGAHEGDDVPSSFAVYSSSEGNYFFHELRDLIAAGLEKIQPGVRVRDDRDGFAEATDCHVIVAPHEFFYLGSGPQLREQQWPAKVVVVNTEQPSTPWFALARQCFSRAFYVWDIDFDSAQRNAEAGYACDFLPLGYVDTSEFARPVKWLPRHYGTCFLTHAARSESYLDAPLMQRPIDVLFIGGATQTREQFFGRTAGTLSKYRCYLHFSSGGPVVPGKNTFMNSKTARGLAQRSKIVLNIHRGPDCYFEWHRIVLLGIWQRALVLSEPSTMGPPFQPDVHFVEAPLSGFAERIDYYLSSRDGPREAQAVIDQGYRRLIEHCDLAKFLSILASQPRPESRIIDRFRSTFELNRSRPGTLRTATGESYEDVA